MVVLEGEALTRVDLLGGEPVPLGTTDRLLTGAVPLAGSPHAILISQVGAGRDLHLRVV